MDIKFWCVRDSDLQEDGKVIGELREKLGFVVSIHELNPPKLVASPGFSNPKYATEITLDDRCSADAR